MTCLHYCYLSPKSGKKAENLMIFLHGYGSQNMDFLDIVCMLGNRFANMSFVLPNAPQSIPLPPQEQQHLSESSLQWFPLKDLSLGNFLDAQTAPKQKQEIVQKGVQAGFPILQNFLDEIQTLYTMKTNQIILFGFSQGAMLALDTALRMQTKMAGVIACAGCLAFGESYPQNYSTKKIPILLCHGKADHVVPAKDSETSYAILQQNNINVELHLSPNTAHHLDASMVQTIENFIHHNIISQPALETA